MKLRNLDKHVAAALVVAAVVALSFAALHGLAIKAGFTDPLAYLWPLAVDAVAYYATRVWLDNGKHHEYGRTLALSAIVVSVLANGGFHYMETYRVSPHWTIVVLVGSVPAIALAPMLHLILATTRDGQDEVGTVSQDGQDGGTVSVPMSWDSQDGGTVVVPDTIPASWGRPALAVPQDGGGTVAGTPVLAGTTQDSDCPGPDLRRDTRDVPQDTDQDSRDDRQDGPRDGQDTHRDSQDTHRDSGTVLQGTPSQDDPDAVLRDAILSREEETGTLPTPSWCKANLSVGHAKASRVLRDIRTGRDGTPNLRAVGE